jgi:hypothetical protein
MPESAAIVRTVVEHRGLSPIPSDQAAMHVEWLAPYCATHPD